MRGFKMLKGFDIDFVKPKICGLIQFIIFVI